MDDILDIPIFPLSTVLFPGGRLPLQIFEPRYLAMTEQCLRDKGVFGVTLIRGGFEVGRPAIPWEVGCTARIVDWKSPGPALYVLMAQGESVFRIDQRRTQDDGLIRARVTLRDPPDPSPLPDRFEPLATLLRRIAAEIGEEHFPQPSRLEDAGWVGYRVAEMLPIAPEQKQQLLELQDPLQLLERVDRLLDGLQGRS
jgi:Lon protease-like protein